MTTSLCVSCCEGPTGGVGHQALAFYVGGPFPGQNIFKCGQCDVRWIRHYGSTSEPFAWTQFVREPRIATPWPIGTRARASA